MCCGTEDIKFADTPTELQYSIGASALLECIATGQPMPTVSWRFNRRKITPGIKYVNNQLVIRILFVKNVLCVLGHVTRSNLFHYLC